ncbi:class I SAM-dependent RNA methyltransferase [Xinfangfangia sp. CPCC 101601]|uniref:Class I SAM-dependent RNA methyltransferase n=1 Tax=Pseudogemmobacter lacusdianii TaxID=3069608 RepID=A0ABU0VTV5_9RHOB|nr:class I SAM-dependent RNA methyltransferase [Xinfangfangia sp. CPCC 101601]MDQ2065156.1 class I SAM-dependent RNA methyltransferase [Xinfangfangia sp. CPCC 101601]
MTLTIDRLGHLGHGIAAGPNGPVYVSGVLPGEVVEGELVGDKLEGVRIVTPSTDRVKPPCPHAKACGGCQLQHASEPFLARWKREVVANALAGQGLSAEPLRDGVITSPARSRRRATLAARKTKGGALVGFYARGSDVIIPVPGCLLLDPSLMALFPAVEALAILGGSRTTTLSVTLTHSLTGPDVRVEGGKPLDSELRMELARLTERFALARLTWDDETVAMRATPEQGFGRARVQMPPAAFLQATAEGEAALVAGVVEALGPQKRVADIFSGLGTFTFPLAETAEVASLEGETVMVEAVSKAVRGTQGLKKIVALRRDLFRNPLEVEDMRGMTGVVLDPPRAGAEAQVQRLAASKVPVIAMVSCNPATFARDARILLAGGYQLDWVQVVDQFRWSHHVELVARFHRPD